MPKMDFNYKYDEICQILPDGHEGTFRVKVAMVALCKLGVPLHKYTIFEKLFLKCYPDFDFKNKHQLLRRAWYGPASNRTVVEMIENMPTKIEELLANDKLTKRAGKFILN